VSVEWFSRIADVPNIGYEGSSDVKRSKLKGSDAIPEIRAYDFEGQRQEDLWWPSTRDGGSGSSPAKEHALALPHDASIQSVLRHLQETLELPGKPEDYHFAIQGAAQLLWQRRKEEPAILDEVERLCWLDIRLIEAQPQAVTNEFRRQGEPAYYQILAFGILLRLYEREGFLHEALAVAELAEKFEQPGSKVEALRQRLARLEAEDADAVVRTVRSD
jgi:hypothetical protein